ncbi:hypothetical protein MTO96_002508 [Rhipicephalus appendiculatus]
MISGPVTIKYGDRLTVFTNQGQRRKVLGGPITLFAANLAPPVAFLSSSTFGRNRLNGGTVDKTAAYRQTGVRVRLGTMREVLTAIRDAPEHLAINSLGEKCAAVGRAYVMD